MKAQYRARITESLQHQAKTYKIQSAAGQLTSFDAGAKEYLAIAYTVPAHGNSLRRCGSATMTNVIVRNTKIEDANELHALCRQVYPFAPPWSHEQIKSHIEMFQEGQFVAVDDETQAIVGMASSLIILWDDYEPGASWRDFTADGFFTNHDPLNGRTLYAAEVMVSPNMRGFGVGKSLYKARNSLLTEKGLLRIRAGARLRGYSKYAAIMSAGEYVLRVALEKIGDPTLSFQLKQGFRVIGVVSQYLRHDPESLGYAAIIEWLNPQVAQAQDWKKQEQFIERLKDRYLQ